jgi:UMF1 family MFS transporter
LYRFFLAFFVFMTGVCAVIAYAGIYAQRSFGFDDAQTIELFILLQLAAALGAFVFGFVQDRLGARLCLAASLAIWCAVAIGAYLVETQTGFRWLAGVAGLVIGSTQSASRALVSRLTQPGQEGETFGYWGLFGKLAAVAGTFGFGMLSSAFDLRLALFLTLCPFILGLVLILSLPSRSVRRC